MFRRKPFYFIALYLSDILSFMAALVISFFVFTDSQLTIYSEIDTHLRLSFILLFLLILQYINYGLYDDKRRPFSDHDFMHIFYSITTVYAIGFFIVLLFEIFTSLPMKFFLLSYPIMLFLTVTGRLILSYILSRERRKGKDTLTIILYGEDVFDLKQKIDDNPSLGYKVTHHITDLDYLKTLLKEAEIVFISRDNISTEMMTVILQNDHVLWKIIPSTFNLVMDNVVFDEFKDFPIINITPKENSIGYRKFKRTIDIFVSGIAMILLFPLLLITALIMKITMPGPIFFTHMRLGKNLNEFKLYKLRSMVTDAEQKKDDLQNEVKGIFKLKEDPRVTKFGKFLRMTCIDELPQLINIFKGDMSFVGPRPHLRRELVNFKDWRMMRFSVRPGLTGYWQVSGRHELNFDKAVLYDIYYIKHMSLLMDLGIIIRTIPAIIFSGGRW